MAWEVSTFVVAFSGIYSRVKVEWRLWTWGRFDTFGILVYYPGLNGFWFVFVVPGGPPTYSWPCST